MYGIALEGGGTKGAYHMGAVKAIFECGFDIGAVVGTSIGAFNAAVIAQGDFEKLYKRWYDGDSTMAIEFDEKELRKMSEKKMDISSLKYWYNFVTKNVSEGGIDTTKLKEMYSSIIDEEKLRQSKMIYGLVTVSLTDKKPLYVYKEDIEKGKLIDYLLASSNLPVFKQQKLVDGKTYIDGGFYDNCPITLLKNKKITNIFEVRTEAIGISRRVDRKGLNIYTITPSKDLGNILFTDNATIRKNMTMGYFDAIRVIKGYIGNDYYVIPTDDNEVFKRIADISDEDILKLKEYMRFTKIEKDTECKKVLLEKILPYMQSKLGRKDIYSYQRLLVATLEEVARECKLEMYKLYTFDELLAVCKEKVGKIIKEEEKALIKNTNKLLMLKFVQIFN